MTIAAISWTFSIVGATLLASAAWLWWWHQRRGRGSATWPDWDNIPHLCMRCGTALPLRDDIDLPDAGTSIVIEYAPIPAQCRTAGVAGWLCGPACAQPWVDHHTALHHPDKETRT